MLIIAALALAWETAARTRLVDPDVLPPLSRVVVVLWGLLHDGDFITDVRITATECLLAFAVVAPLGARPVGFAWWARAPRDRAGGRAGPLQLLMSVPKKSVFLPPCSC